MKIMMRIKISVLSICVCLCIYSCSSHKNIFGTYYRKSKLKEYTLTLKEDSTFYVEISYNVEWNPKPNCSGKFTINRDTIILNCCEDNDPLQVLTPDYWNDRCFRMVILNQKIKYKDVILKRKKSTRLGI